MGRSNPSTTKHIDTTNRTDFLLVFFWGVGVGEGGFRGGGDLKKTNPWDREREKKNAIRSIITEADKLPLLAG